MGKRSNRSGARRRSTSTTPLPQPGRSAPLPAVGGREPCPCGSGRRYKACHGRGAAQETDRLVARPFEGLPGEVDWVMMREIVPAGTARVRVGGPAAGEHEGREITVATVLPFAWPALTRVDGEVFVALQVPGRSGDPSRDVAGALLQALAAPSGTAPPATPAGSDGVRLQEVIDLGQTFDVVVHDGFDFWIEGVPDVDAETRASMERANAQVIPTVRLESVEGAYWARMRDRCHLRWGLAESEDALLDAMARLHAAGRLSLGEGSRYVGAFRADGLLVPVWDLPGQAEAGDVEGPAAGFRARLDQALALSDPLTPAQRRARNGLLSRQLTLR